MSTIMALNGQEESEGLRLLSFDGGDLRAVSHLIVLEEIMRRVQWDRKSPTPILPCDYFHMMAGVGTGGIIVLLLTALRMGVEDAIQEFIEIWTLVFADASLDRVARSSKLEGVIKDLLKRRGLPEDQKLCGDGLQDASCKAFFCAVPETNLSICEKFRSYKSRESSTNPTIVEAIRASCAAPALFTTVLIKSIGCHVAYVTGAYNFNNPARETIMEAGEYFQRGRLVGCVLSLGCGQRVTSSLNHSAGGAEVMSLAEDIASDCDLVERELAGRIGQSNVYYRLSVDQNLTSNVDSLLHPIENITALTKTFLEHPTTVDKVNRCVETARHLERVNLMDICGFVEPRAAAVYGLPPLSTFFVERPALVEKMARCLFRGGPLAQRRMVLSGLGGIGKTQIAISFLLQFLPRFRHVLFIDGSSEQSIETGLITRVKSLGTTYSRSSARDALDVLANPDYEITRDWAIIYDNVDNPDINIGRYFPSCAFGTIFITTRNPNVGILAPKAHLKLDVMSGGEAAEVLLRSAIDPSREPTDVEKEEVHEIAKELGYLPGALVQAGYFIRIHDCLGKYRERLRKRRPDILGRPAEHQLDPHDGLYGTLDLTWPHLTPGAQNLMSILGFVNYTGFPVILLYRAVARGFLFEPFELADRPPSFQDTIRLLCATFRPQEEPDEQDVDDVVAELEKYSLVTRMITFKVTTLRLHPLVHSWTRDRLPKQEKVTYRAAAVRLLVCGTGRNDEDIYEFIVPHFEELSNWVGELHLNDRAGLATVISHRGRLQEAIEIWIGIQKSLKSSQEIRSHPATNITRELRCSEVALQLARLRWRPGDSCTSIVVEDEVLKVRKRILGCEHPKTLEAVVQQARAMRYTSAKDAEKLLRSVLNAWEGQPDNSWEAVLQTKEALARCCGMVERISLYREILQDRAEKNGPDHHGTLKAMENLANNFSSSASATDMWISLVTARTSSRGREHPDTLDAMENLARSYTFQLLYAKSVEQWKEVIRLRKGAQGAGHGATISAMNALALTIDRTGQKSESMALLKEIVHVARETHGPSHTIMLQAMRELAKFYDRNKQYTEAEVQWKKIVWVIKEAHGANHTGTLEATRDLVDFYNRNKQYAEAELQLKEIARVMKEAHGASDTDTLRTTRELAKFYDRNKQCTEAEAQWKKIVWVIKEAHGASHTDTLKAMRELVDFYNRNKQYAEAELQLKEIVRVMKEAHGASDMYTLQAMGELAKFYDRGKQYTEAEAQRKKIVWVTKEAHGASHKDTLKAMKELVDFYERSQQYTEVEAQWKEIVQVIKEAHGARHTGTLEAMRELVDFYDRNKQYAEGVLQWKEIVHLTKDAKGPSHRNTLDAMEGLAKMYEHTQQYDEAELQWKEMVQIVSYSHDPSHWDTLCAMKELAAFYERIQQYTKAEVQWKETVQMAKEIPESGHCYTSWIMRGMAGMYKTTGRYEDAEAVLVDATNYDDELASKECL